MKFTQKRKKLKVQKLWNSSLVKIKNGRDWLDQQSTRTNLVEFRQISIRTDSIEFDQIFCYSQLDEIWLEPTRSKFGRSRVWPQMKFNRIQPSHPWQKFVRMRPKFDLAELCRVRHVRNLANLAQWTLPELWWNLVESTLAKFDWINLDKNFCKIWPSH